MSMETVLILKSVDWNSDRKQIFNFYEFSILIQNSSLTTVICPIYWRTVASMKVLQTCTLHREKSDAVSVKYKWLPTLLEYPDSVELLLDLSSLKTLVKAAWGVPELGLLVGLSFRVGDRRSWFGGDWERWTCYKRTLFFKTLRELPPADYLIL
jgi:hypothetical protein